MTVIDYSYEHILFYDDRKKAEIALEHVLTTFDASAELIPLEKGHPYAVTFTTEEEFTQQEANALVQTVTPCEYDLNYYPWDSDEEDDEDEEETGNVQRTCCYECSERLTVEELSTYPLEWQCSGDMYCSKHRVCPDDCRRTPCLQLGNESDEEEEGDFPEVFTAQEREIAIAQSEDNDWTIEYITRLERIAYTAYVFYVKSCNLPVTLPQASYDIATLSVADLTKALHEELATVNFMEW